MNVVLFPVQHDDQKWIDEYENYLYGKSAGTIDAYTRIVRQFFYWLSGKPGAEGGFRPELLTRTMVVNYLKELEQLSIGHQSRVKSAISGFSEWLIEEKELLHKNPTKGLLIPSQAQLVPRELSDDQRHILKGLVKRDGSQRSAAIFALGYWAGCRVSDVSWLRVENVHEGWLKVGFKDEKMRDIDILNEVWQPMHNYLEEERKQSHFVGSPFVFTSQRGQRLTENGIHHWMRALKSKATLNENSLISDITFQDLRHDFAHRALAGKMFLEEVAVYLGHIKKQGTPAIETTVRYTLPSREQIKEKLKNIMK